MTYIIIAIVILVVIVGFATMYNMRQNSKGKSSETQTPEEQTIQEGQGSPQEKQKEEQQGVKPQGECCGAHEVCENDLKRISTQIEYFEDEHLDKYKSCTPDSYSDEEIEDFREVLYTLKSNEIEAWLISLEKREIELPLILRPEAIEMIDDNV